MTRSAHQPSPVDPGLDGVEPPLPPRSRGAGRGSDAYLSFEYEGARWIARVAGAGALGTGRVGLGFVEAVHFCTADAPDKPLREALLAAGRFDTLHEIELAELCGVATPIRLPKAR
jgi:hypothetical protein